MENKCSSVLSVRANGGKPLYIRQKPAFQAIKSRSLKCSQVFAKCSPRGLRPFRVRQPLHLCVTSVTCVTRPTKKPEILGENGSRHFPRREFLSVTKCHYVSPNSGGGFGRCYIEKKRSMRSMRSGKQKKSSNIRTKSNSGVGGEMRSHAVICGRIEGSVGPEANGENEYLRLSAFICGSRVLLSWFLVPGFWSVSSGGSRTAPTMFLPVLPVSPVVKTLFLVYGFLFPVPGAQPPDRSRGQACAPTKSVIISANPWFEGFCSLVVAMLCRVNLWFDFLLFLVFGSRLGILDFGLRTWALAAF